jgi:murein DD-endopeptidase MepM/ murein hydrolase activator NlpD
VTRRADGHLARWALLGLGIILVAGLLFAAARERDRPTASAADPRGWTEPAKQPFVRPTATPSPTTGATRTTPAPRYVFPVGGKSSYGRKHHDYPATDIIAGCGQTVLAVTDGVILEVSRSDTYDAASDHGGERGGLFVSLLGDDGVRYYGSHLRAVRTGIEAGVRVKLGESLGGVGDSGHASLCHLHFGISPPCAQRADWWLRRGVIWPWSYLDSWRTGGALSPIAAVTAWQRQNGCPGAPQ